MTQLRKISVVGLGKLGLCLAAALASKGYRVIGVDKDPERVRIVNSHRAPFFEPLLEKLLQDYSDSISATQDFSQAIQSTDATFVVVNTPSETDGSFSVSQLKDACSKIGQALRFKDAYHLVVVTSTVLPKTTRGVVKPAIEANSGKNCGGGFGLCYNPEFIALGEVIPGLTHPDFVLIGEFDDKSGLQTQEVYEKLCGKGTPFARMSLENAELTKIALNSYVTMKISFANTIAELCEHLPSADVDTVTRALGLDRRIGSAYLKGGLGFGGPCFPRDNKAFAFAAKELGCAALLAETVDKVNEHQTSRIAALVRSNLRKGAKVGILGATYKPNTEIVEASPPLDLAAALARDGFRVSIYDPIGLRNAEIALGSDFHYASSVKDCLVGVDACIIATPWKEFTQLTYESILGLMKGSVIVDCWRILGSDQKVNDADLVRIGESINNARS